MPFSDDYRDSILNYVFSLTAFSPAVPATIYFALSYADPTGDGSGLDEPTDDPAYERVALTNNATNFPAAVDAEKMIDTEILFPTAEAAYSDTVTHVAFMDAATDGNMIGYVTLDSALTVGIGETVALSPGDLVMALVDYPT